MAVMMDVAVTRRVSCFTLYIYIYYRCTFFVSGMEATPASAPRANAAKRGAASGPKNEQFSIVFSQ